MTESYSADVQADEIDTPDTPTADLDRQADALLREGERKTFGGVSAVRQAIREDAAASRDWARDRARRLNATVREEPIRASLYALGIGVVIGLLAAR